MSLHSPNSGLRTLLTLNDAVATTQDLGEPQSHTTATGPSEEMTDNHQTGGFPFSFQSHNRHRAV